MSATLFGILLYSFICAAFCTFIASEKGRSKYNWFWFGFIFGIIALIALAALPVKTPES